TQNPELRSRFTGQAEHVVAFFEFVAQQVRELLAALGLRSVDEAVGRVDLLDTDDAVGHWKTAGLDLAPVLASIDPAPGTARRRVRGQDHGLEPGLDVTLIERAALDEGLPVRLDLPVRNVHRSVGTRLGHEVTRRHGAAGLPDGTIDVTLRGTAGQSFGSVLPPGITLRLLGDANDYVGKSLSGGLSILRL